MHFDKFSFGSLQIDGSTYEHDVVIDRGEIRTRKPEIIEEGFVARLLAHHQQRSS